MPSLIHFSPLLLLLLRRSGPKRALPISLPPSPPLHYICLNKLPMAGKISTLILTVDLDCYICSKKIRKTICKLQDREQIQTVTFDEKNNTVTISGFFDPQKLKKKLLCKACKVIKEIKIKEEDKKPPPPKDTKPPEPEKPKPPPPEKPKEPAQPEKPKEKPKEPEKPKEKPKEPEKPKEKPKEPEKPKEKPKEPEKEKPKPPPKEPEKEKPKAPEPAQGNQPVSQPGPLVPCCCWRPCYEQYYGGCRCCSCGMFYGWTGPPLPPAMGTPSTSTCQFFCEEDPSTCTVM
ncbi:protein PYRICULARIA ORYZAE RESISTANCE 21-like [Phalaenopsis equestris]|uniref:protein PYRICULARIA ORYZAE RESISTANCE 21-like n=1 Tax=Phalaenopsis equestris TaxID=78828 RepID=UPI0009E625A6|nr:protein PYRICULARIA ORYZAE RESISTANCE 21-like [Phalaenopsis equestris]